MAIHCGSVIQLVLLRYILILSKKTSKRSVTSQSLVQSLVTKNADFGVFVGKEGVIFFSTKIYRDHIDILLSELGYSESVLRLFEKMTFSLVDPLDL